MKKHATNHQPGFTLLEFIVVLVVASIMASMVYTYFGNTLTQSGDPIQRLQKASNLAQVMENIVADYKRLNALNLRYNWKASTSYRVGSVVIPTTSNGYYYTCVTAGTSGTTVPSHTTGTVNDGGVPWKVGGIIWKSIGTPVENIVWKTSRYYAVNDIMIPINNDGHYYRCTTAHTSPTTEPATWTWVSGSSYLVGRIVRPNSYNGRFYRCTQAGTSGGTEPTWQPLGTLTTDNNVRWQEVWAETGTILARSNAATSSNDDVLNDNIYNYLTTAPARYGTGYTVVAAETRFIHFNNAGVQQPVTGNTTGEKNILKVTIQDSATTETLTQLFTIR